MSNKNIGLSILVTFLVVVLIAVPAVASFIFNTFFSGEE